MAEQKYRVTYDIKNVKTNLLVSESMMFVTFSEATNFMKALRNNVRSKGYDLYGTPTVEKI
mgnify:FL=1|jgi:hypothetical protein